MLTEKTQVKIFFFSSCCSKIQVLHTWPWPEVVFSGVNLEACKADRKMQITWQLTWGASWVRNFLCLVSGRHMTLWLTNQDSCKSLVLTVVWSRFWISALACPSCLLRSEPPLSALTLSVSTSVMWVILPASSRSHQEKRNEERTRCLWNGELVGLTAGTEIQSHFLLACCTSAVSAARERRPRALWL